MFHEERVVLPNGVEGEILTIPTANPASYFEVVSGASMPAVDIFGQLFLPLADEPLAVVIIVPGSLGVAAPNFHKAEWLVNAGIAACVIDPFGMRGVTSTVANQAQYTFAASAWDVLVSVRRLSQDPRIDAGRIGIQGHSRGGAAVVTAATLAQRIDGEFPIRGVYGAYPWCGHQFLRPVVGSTTVRSIVGDQDEWLLPQQVQAHMNAIALTGGDASFRLVEGAHHSLDRDTPLEYIADASVSPGAPTIYIDDEGVMIDPRTSEAAPHLTERDLMLYCVKSGHGRRGAHLGTADNYAGIFRDDMMNFWQTLLA